MERFQCINVGHCRAADSNRKFYGARRFCPVCRQKLIPVKHPSSVWVGVGVAVAVVGITITVFLIAKSWGQGATNPPLTTGDIRRNSRPSVEPGKYFDDPKVVALVEAALALDSGAFDQSIARGAELKSRGGSGLTPAHLALLNANLEALSMILKAGGDANAVADNGDSVTGLAAMMEDSKYLSECLKHGARPDLADGRKETPLMVAAALSRRGNVRLLLEAGADPNGRDARSLTPLMHTFQALAPDVEIARMLIRSGARPEDSNAAGLTARHYADTFEDAALLAVFSK